METRNGAFRQAEGALHDAAKNIKDRMQSPQMRDQPKAQNNMGGMKDALRDTTTKRPGSY